MKESGDLRDLNRAFKEMREVDHSIRCVDYVEAQKALMLEAVARGAQA